MTFLSKLDFERLEKWKYYQTGRGVLEEFVRALWWNRAIWFVPKNVAPCTITLLGFLSGVFCFSLLLTHSPALKDEVPGWVLVICAFGLLFYQTMDALDGKQSRLTGRHSAIEDMYDHAADSLNSSFQFIISTSCLRMGLHQTIWMILFMVGRTAFSSAHWRTYATGIFNVGLVDHTEIQLIGVVVMFLTAAYGSQLWLAEIQVSGMTVSAFHVTSSILIAFAVIKTLENVKVMLDTKKTMSPVSTFSLGFIMFAASFYRTKAWMDQENLCVLFALFFSFFVTKQDVRVLISHYVGRPYVNAMDISLVPIFLFTCGTFYLQESESLYWSLVICCLFSLIDVARCFVGITREIAAYHGIEIFRLRKGDRKFWECFETKYRNQ